MRLSTSPAAIAWSDVYGPLLMRSTTAVLSICRLSAIEVTSVFHVSSMSDVSASRAASDASVRVSGSAASLYSPMCSMSALMPSLSSVPLRYMDELETPSKPMLVSCAM